jgi:phosphoglycolate phosphatase
MVAVNEPKKFRPRSLIFDLDGTFWDTTVTCAVVWNEVLLRHGIEFREIVPDDVRSVTGRPHEEAVRTVFATLPEPQLQLLVSETATEDNRAIALHGGILYPGVIEGLERLHTVYPLHIVSNCQAGYIEIFLKTAGVDRLFSDFECWGNTGRSKGENLRAVVERNQLESPLFVGDTDGDYRAAVEAGVPFLQVTYGFGDPLENVSGFPSFDSLTDHLIGGVGRSRLH